MRITPDESPAGGFQSKRKPLPKATISDLSLDLDSDILTPEEMDDYVPPNYRANERKNKFATQETFQAMARRITGEVGVTGEEYLKRKTTQTPQDLEKKPQDDTLEEIQQREQETFQREQGFIEEAQQAKRFEEIIEGGQTAWQIISARRPEELIFEYGEQWLKDKIQNEALDRVGKHFAEQEGLTDEAAQKYSDDFKAKAGSYIQAAEIATSEDPLEESIEVALKTGARKAAGAVGAAMGGPAGAVVAQVLVEVAFEVFG